MTFKRLFYEYGKILIFMLFFTMPVSELLPVPAYPYPIRYKQPDGKCITIQLKGDEKVHWAESTDGYTLLSNGKNGWEYAVKDVAGNLKSSGVLARDANERTEKEKKLLISLQVQLRFSPQQVKMLKSAWEMKRKSDELIGTGSFFGTSNPLQTNSNDGRKKIFTPRGEKKLLMILIQYPDVPFTYTRQDFVELMNTQNYNLNGAQGCVQDFFREMSYGQFIVTTEVAPHIYTADHEMAYYGTNDANGDDQNAGVLMKEACEKADADGVDFTQYDNDGDGSVDGVYIVYSGYGEATSGIENTIWPHAGGISGETFDGKTVSKYSCSNELNYNGDTNPGTLTSIGVICHEFGHVCGAPDYYDTDYSTGGQFPGTGYWDLMAVGGYNSTNGNSGSKPAHFNPFEKVRAGWITPVTLTNPTSLTLPDVTTNPVAYIYNTNTSGEYYIMENRQKTGFNAGCPGHGLMIYHYSKSYWDVQANTAAPQGFYPVYAGATASPTTTSTATSYGTINSGKCPFPGTTSKTSFTDATTPSAKSWAGDNTDKPITGITESGNDISLVFINTPAVNPILFFSATPLASTDIRLLWSNNTAGNNVVIARNTTSVFGTPATGTSYTVGSSIDGGGTVVYSGSGTSFDDSGLTPSTNYYYQIWATDGTNYSNACVANATTACVSTSTPLFTEGFEGGSLPSCWTQEYVLGVKDWTFQTGGYTGGYGPATAHTGTKNACFYGNGWTSYTAKLISPPLDLSSAANPVLKFWHTQKVFGGQDILRVYYRTSATDTWKQLAIYTNSISDWTLESVSLPNVSSTYYIAFEANANYGLGVCIDDVEVWKNGGTNQWTGAVSTDWFNASNWSAGVVPTSTNDVEIASGATYYPVISATGAVCGNLTIDNTSTMTLGDGFVVNGNVLNNGTLNGGSGTVNVAGNWTNNGIFNYQTSTIIFNGTNDLQIINGTAATTGFYNIKVSKGSKSRVLEAKSIITLNNTASSTAPLQITSGTFKLSSASTITPFSWATLGGNAGFWNNGGTVTIPAFYLYGSFFTNTTGTSNIGVLSVYGTGGLFTLEGGTVNITSYFGPYGGSASNTATYVQTGGDLVINSTSGTIPFNLNSGSAFSMSGGNIIIQKASTATADFQNLASTSTVTGGTLQIGNTLTSGNNLVKINSTVPVYNLTLNAKANLVAQLVTNNVSVLNNVTIGSGAKLDLNSLTLSVGGGWLNNGGSLGDTPTGTVVFNSVSAQTLAGTAATTFNNLTLNNSAGLSLSGNVDAVVNGNLNFTSGIIATGANKVVVGAGGSVSRTSGHVNGNLQKNVSSGIGVTANFEIGDAAETAYKPVSVTFANVSGSGTLMGTVATGDEPNIATSQLDPANGLNNYWTLTNSGVAFDSYGATFTFLPSDVEGTATVSDWLAAKYSVDGWTYPMVSARTSNSISISGVTSFSDFAFGAKKTITGVSEDGDGDGVFAYQNKEGNIVVNIKNMDGVADIMVYNAFGQALVKATASDSVTVLNKNFPAGVYLVSVRKEGKIFLGKVLVK